MYVLDPVLNGVEVTVSTGYDNIATSIVLASGEGAKLPDPTSGNFNLVWYNSTDYKRPFDDPNVEIIRVTAKSTDTLTVVRPAVGNNYNGEGSGNTAKTHNTAGKTYKMILALTRRQMELIDTSLNGKKTDNVSATSKILGRKTTGAGVIEELTAADTRTIINVADGATANTKATGAEVDTGTDDVKFATPKALADQTVLLKKTGGALSGALNEAKGTDIASATITDIGAATGNYVVVTGTITITGLGTVQAGTRRIINFSGILILTHNATSLILPTAANITTAVGDTATFISLGSGNWICANYQRKDGTTLANSGSGFITIIRTTNFTTTSASYVDVTGLTFSALANTKYLIDAMIFLKSSLNGSNCGVQLSSPTGALISGYTKREDTTTVGWNQRTSNISTVVYSADTIGNPIHFMLFVEVGSTAGTISVQAMAIDGPTTIATVMTGSKVIYGISQ